ncbi:MAG: SAM-dependent methyltransferase, partial [Methylococcaceae bacterium]|nr:SAM-dependent methyltransferase [Methylococcaceae bacterium]
FTNTQIPACIWFLTKNKKERAVNDDFYRDRSGEVLFIDARNLGYMKDRVLRDFSPEDLETITKTYHGWRMNYGQCDTGDGSAAMVDPNPDYLYEDVAGFCKSAKLEEMKKHDFILTPGRYVGVAMEEDDGEPFAEKMKRLTGQLKQQFEEGERLEGEIRKNLAGLGYDI